MGKRFIPHIGVWLENKGLGHWKADDYIKGQKLCPQLKWNERWIKKFRKDVADDATLGIFKIAALRNTFFSLLEELDVVRKWRKPKFVRRRPIAMMSEQKRKELEATQKKKKKSKKSKQKPTTTTSEKPAAKQKEKQKSERSNEPTKSPKEKSDSRKDHKAQDRAQKKEKTHKKSKKKRTTTTSEETETEKPAAKKKEQQQSEKRPSNEPTKSSKEKSDSRKDPQAQDREHKSTRKIRTWLNFSQKCFSRAGNHEHLDRVTFGQEMHNPHFRTSENSHLRAKVGTCVHGLPFFFFFGGEGHVLMAVAGFLGDKKTRKGEQAAAFAKLQEMYSKQMQKQQEEWNQLKNTFMQIFTPESEESDGSDRDSSDSRDSKRQKQAEEKKEPSAPASSTMSSVPISKETTPLDPQDIDNEHDDDTTRDTSSESQDKDDGDEGEVFFFLPSHF